MPTISALLQLLKIGGQMLLLAAEAALWVVDFAAQFAIGMIFGWKVGR